MIIHNRGWGPQIEDALFVDQITGHYRYNGPPPKQDVEKASTDGLSKAAGATAGFREWQCGDADRVCSQEPGCKSLAPPSISNAAVSNMAEPPRPIADATFLNLAFSFPQFIDNIQINRAFTAKQ